MNSTTLPPTTRERIADVNDRLTPTERRLAEGLIADPTLVAFGTVSDVADRFDVSRPSVVRFARKLGFDGYPELQGRVRTELTHNLTRPSERIRSGTSAADGDRGELAKALADVFDDVSTEMVRSLVEPLVDARSVYVLSGETSMAGAHVLSSGLVMLRRDVSLLTDHAAGRSLANAGTSDAAVVFDFHRYRRATHAAATHLASLGVTIVGVTDGALSPVAQLADVWCGVRVPGVGPFDSSMPAVVVAELMVSELARLMGPIAVESIDRTEAAWDATGTFLP